MPRGKIAFYHDGKGYGFIEPEEGDGDEDIFFHISDVEGNENEPDEDDEVEFETEQGDKGLRAVNIKRV